MLKLDIKPGESIAIGDVAVITLEQKSGKTARLGFRADKGIRIERIKRPSIARFVAGVGLGAEKNLA